MADSSKTVPVKTEYEQPKKSSVSKAPKGGEKAKTGAKTSTAKSSEGKTGTKTPTAKSAAGKTGAKTSTAKSAAGKSGTKTSTAKSAAGKSGSKASGKSKSGNRSGSTGSSSRAQKSAARKLMAAELLGSSNAPKLPEREFVAVEFARKPMSVDAVAAEPQALPERAFVAVEFAGKPLTIDAPAQARAKVETPSEAPVQAKVEAPTETLAETPAEASPKAPKETPTETPAKSGKKDMIISAAILPAVLFFHELVLNTMTVRNAFRYAIIPMALFCVIYGLIGYLFASLFRNSRVNRAVKIILMTVTPIAFGVEYFVYRQFKIFYDVRTVKGGASGVATQFAGDALKLIFSPTGILAVILLVAPLVLYCVFARKIDPARPPGAKGRLAVITLILIACGLNYAAVNAVDLYKYSYDERYSFPTAVENFGLMTGLRLDVTRGLTGKSGGNYDIDPADGTEDSGTAALPEFLHVSVSNITKQATQGKLVYDKNVLDIDFDALGASAGGALQAMDNYVKAQEPSSQNEMTGLFAGKNLIFISAEAFAAEAIDPVRTPTLYRLATRGFNFTDYYQPASAGTTGGEFENIFGMLPMYGGASMGEMTGNLCYYTMSYQLNQLGYYGMAFHNNDYTYYSRNVTHNKLGFSEGYYGVGNGLESYITEQWPESDLEMMEATVDWYIDHQPFNIYYMTVSGHSRYSYGGNAMSRKNWDSVEGLDASDTIKAYMACNVELDKALEYLVRRLEEKGIADDTVIVLSADHFPYGLDDDGALGNMPYLSELYGYNVTNLIQRDHNRLIMWSGCLEDELEYDEPIVIDSPTFSLDILPTLLNLYGIEFDSRVLVGRDVFSNREALIFDLNHDWKTDKGTYIAGSDSFTPAEGAGEVDSSYISRMNSIVTNKINYCSDVITYDYYRHLFG